jgi:hypothetical protein
LNRLPMDENLYEDFEFSSPDLGKRLATKEHFDDPSNA